MTVGSASFIDWLTISYRLLSIDTVGLGMQLIPLSHRPRLDDIVHDLLHLSLESPVSSPRFGYIGQGPLPFECLHNQNVHIGIQI